MKGRCWRKMLRRWREVMNRRQTRPGRGDYKPPPDWWTDRWFEHRKKD